MCPKADKGASSGHLSAKFFNCFLSRPNLIPSLSVTTCKGGRLCLCRKKVFSHEACHCKTGAKVVDNGN